MSELHVVFGAGPVGRSVMEELVRQGKPVRVVSRSGSMGEVPQGVELTPQALSAVQGLADAETAKTEGLKVCAQQFGRDILQTH